MRKNDIDRKAEQETKEKFVKLLKELMEKGHWTQLSLAKKLGLRQSQVHNWLYAHSLPSYISIQKLCNTFNIRAGELLLL